MATQEQRAQNGQVIRLAVAAQDALEELQKVIGADYTAAINEMERLLQQLQNAPTLRSHPRIADRPPLDWDLL